jgi:hypothetical protein
MTTRLQKAVQVAVFLGASALAGYLMHRKYDVALTVSPPAQNPDPNSLEDRLLDQYKIMDPISAAPNDLNSRNEFENLPGFYPKALKSTRYFQGYKANGTCNR